MTRRTLYSVLLFLMLVGTESSAQRVRQNVLVLSSYHQGLSWTDSIVDGIKSVLDKEARHVDLWFEYMDTKRIFHNDSFRSFYELYKERFQAHHFDLILAADNNAFNFLRLYHARLFPETPVVFCGVNSFHDSLLDGHELFTGVAEIPDFTGTFELALSLHPDTQHFIVINDRTVSGEATQPLLDHAISLYDTRVHISLYRDITINELLQIVSSAPPKTLIFIVLLNRDAAGQYFSYKRSMELVSNKAQAPVYGFWDFYLGHGVTGGSMLSGYRQGEAAARIALRVLSGEEIDSIPVQKQGIHQYMFDYEQLQRFGLTDIELPPESLVIHRPVSFYDQHRFWILGVAGLAGLVVILATVVQLRTADLRKANVRLHHDIDTRKKIERMLRTTRDSLSRRVDELATLNRITQTIATVSDLHSMLQIISKEMVLLFNARNSGIALLNDSQTALTVVADYIRNQSDPSAVGIVLPLENNFATLQVLEQKQGVLVSQAQSNPLTKGMRDILRKRRTQSLMIVPLLARGEVIGTIGIDSTDEEREFTPAELKLAETIAGQIAGGIENARQVQQTTEALHETQLLYKVSRILAKSYDIQQGIEQVLGEYLYALGLKQGGVSLFDMEKPCGRLYAFFQDGRAQPPGLEIPNLSQVHQKIIANGQPLAILDALNEPLLKENREIIRDLNITSILLVPLLVRGKVIGLLGADSTITTRNFSEREIALAQSIADQVAATIDRAQLLEEAYRAIEAAEAANQAKNIFFANMSHDLRTPLNAILGLTRIMVRTESLPSETTENLRTIQHSGEYLLQLINNVLDISRIEAGRMPLEERDVDLYQLLDDLRNMFSLKVQEKMLRLSFHCTPDVPQYIRTDAVKLRQVLINLLNNAIKFTEHGTVSVDVEAIDDDEVRYPLKRLLFRVKDTGPGIASEEFDKIFEAFVQTTAGHQTREGSGLGLSICRKFVQLMGGNIRVKSSIGQGTTFTFDIIVQQIERLASDVPEAMRRVVALEPGQPQYRLLVVDDRADNRAVLCQLLRPIGFEVREAGSGQEAIEVWKQWEPRLIWMDRRMGALNGHETTRRIRALKHGAQPVIITVTADIFEEKCSTEHSCTCDDFLQKPFHEGDVFRLLRKHLGVRFIYAEEENSPSALNRGAQGTAAEQPGLTADQLTQLPVPLYQELRQASETLHLEAIQALIVRIRESNGKMAEALEMLVGQYRFDILQRLLKEADNDQT